MAERAVGQMMDTLHSMKSPMSNAKNTRHALTQPVRPFSDAPELTVGAAGQEGGG